jgi:hypothetical protein
VLTITLQNYEGLWDHIIEQKWLYFVSVAWPSGLLRCFWAPVISMTWVRIPAGSCLISRHLSFEPGCMSPKRRLVFGVFMVDNPCCVQIMFIFETKPFESIQKSLQRTLINILVVNRKYCIQKKMVGGIGMHKCSIIPEKRRARVLIPPGYLHPEKISH